MADRDKVCLDCPLDDCKENDPDCLFWKGQTPAQRYYAKKRLCPKFKSQHYQRNKKYRQTPKGKKSASACAVRWQKKNPAAQKVIRRRHFLKNKDKINATRAIYRARKREERLCLMQTGE